MPVELARKRGVAWLLLCLALALHVADEALTGFLSVYNPTIVSLRSSLPWLPMPVFRFDVWLGGLIGAVVVLAALSYYAFKGVNWIRPAGIVLAVFMLFNAASHTAATLLGHTVAEVRFDGPMPGFYSSPFLFAASLYLLIQLRKPKPPSTALP